MEPAENKPAEVPPVTPPAGNPKPLEKWRSVSLESVTKEAGGAIVKSGQRDWKFLRSVWFWIIAGPVNFLITLAIIAWGFPQIFLGFPKIPAGYENEKKFVLINLARQAAFGYEKGKLMQRYVILTGKKTHATPVGKFRVTRKDKNYHSREFDAPMPYSLFFVESRGIAMHYSFAVGPKWCLRQFFGLESEIGSHGCVRLAPLGSYTMFKWADIGTPVLVIDPRIKE